MPILFTISISCSILVQLNQKFERPYLEPDKNQKLHTAMNQSGSFGEVAIFRGLVFYPYTGDT